ncbi:MAG: ABC transporter ATP-binding protein [Chitinophagales bacterium]|nr:ABC transporter ATP-binding protein [Chitinophagales bacterium]
MAKPIITVENVSKRYRIGLKEQVDDSVGGAIMSILKSPFNNFKKLRNLTSFDKDDEAGVFWALRDVSFQLKQGDVLGVIGKNGAGKSTLLKVLSRITPPTTGHIEINGRVSSLLEVGTGFHQDLTGRENVYLNGTILGMKRKEIEKKFDEIVAFSGIEKFIDTPVKRYSSGMTVRLAFAVAAHLEPDIMIIDEVLAVGDAEFQKKCLGKMQDVSEHGRTVLFVSHNMQAMQSLCNKSIMLENGKLKMEGRTDEVINFYLSKHSANQVEKVWDSIDTADGNELIRMRAARISKTDGTGSDVFYVNSDLNFEFEFWNLEDGSMINLSIVLNTIKGETIFNALSAAKRISKGVHRIVFYVPGNLLNDDVYSIDLYFVKNTTDVIFRLESAISFEVHDIPRETGWYGKWIGAVRPILKTDYLEID